MNTDASWCPIINTEFLGKEFLSNKKCTDALTEARVYFHAYESSVKCTPMRINLLLRQFTLTCFHSMCTIESSFINY